MAEKTAIQWTGSTINPFRARNTKTGKVGWFCTHASDGCRFCYAEKLNVKPGATGGTGIPFKPGHLENGDVELWVDENMLRKPLHKREPELWFPFSMTDWAADFYRDEDIDRWFAVMALTPHHTYQMLTKRDARMRAYLNDPKTPARVWRQAELTAPEMLNRAHAYQGTQAGQHTVWPLRNVWMGVSVENQANMVRLLNLRYAKAALRWISYEPAIGRADFCEAFDVWWNQTRGVWVKGLKAPFDWIVVGGESGSDRVFHTEWALSVIEVGAAAEVKVFVKQLGATVMHQGKPLRLVHPKGGDMDEWPKELRVRQMPAGLAVPVKTKKEARA